MFYSVPHYFSNCMHIILCLSNKMKKWNMIVWINISGSKQHIMDLKVLLKLHYKEHFWWWNFPVGIRKWRPSSQDVAFKEGSSRRGGECDVKPLYKDLERPVCADVLFSAGVKWVSEKCWLHAYCLCCLLASSALQGMPRLSAYSWALRKHETRKYRNGTVIHIVSILHYIFTVR